MLQHIDPAEHILCGNYEQVARDLGVTFCANEGIADLFRDGASGVVVSAYSDYGIHEQEKSHPNADLVKMAQSIPWDQVAALRDHYRAFQLGPACKVESCDNTHKYSIKIDRHTLATFPDVPNEVRHWFAANLNINHPKAKWIPFGLSSDPPGYSLLLNHFNKPKTGLLYVNFEHRTADRLALKQCYSQRTWATLRIESNLPVDQYLEEVASHKFVLCPFGNGLDCYRTYEAIYLGSIPIVPRCVMSDHMLALNLPVLVADNLTMLDEGFLQAVWNQASHIIFNYEPLKLSYWRKRIGECV